MAIATCVFHLEQLVLHIQDDLFDHLLGLLGLIDQVIEVRPDQRSHTFQ